MNFSKIYKVYLIILLFKINHIYGIGRLYTSEANNQYYIECDDKYNWMESQIACLEMNMSLVEITTSDKTLDLRNLIENIQNDNDLRNISFWVGGFLTRYPVNHFVWLSTGENVTYTNWYANNPNFYARNEFCLQIVMERNLGWNDNPCINENGFVCEQLPGSVNDILKEKLQILSKIQENLNNEMKQSKKILQEENDKITQLEESLAIVTNDTMDLQQALQDLQNLRPSLIEKLNQLEENRQNYELSLQTEFQSHEDIEELLSIKRKLNKLLENQIQGLKDEMSAISEDNIRQEKEEQQRLEKDIEKSLKLQNHFQKLLDDI